MSTSLDNITVLVTRPEHQAEAFCEMVESAAGHVVRFPVIEIKEIPLDEQSKVLLQETTDCMIFISANAVRLGVPAVEQTNPKRFEQSRIMAIGKATAKQLEEQGMNVDLVPPSPYNSEALLGMPEIKDVSGKTFTVIKGKGGRRHLMEQLRLRGGYVNEIDIYVRTKPKARNTPLTDLMSKDNVVVSVTSVKGLHHLFEMASEEQSNWLKANAQFLVPGNRVAEAVRDLHIKHAPLVAENATDAVMLERLIAR